MTNPNIPGHPAVFLDGMNDDQLEMMQDYEVHRLALNERIRDAENPVGDIDMFKADLGCRLLASAGRFGNAFLALYSYSEGDLTLARRLTQRLWYIDDKLCLESVGVATGKKFQLNRQPLHYEGMVQNGTESRRNPDEDERYTWARQLSRRYEHRTRELVQPVDQLLEVHRKAAYAGDIPEVDTTPTITEGMQYIGERIVDFFRRRR